MIQHIALFKLRPEVTPEKLDEIIRTTRSQLLKIPEVLRIKSGKKVDPACEWPFFIAVEVDSMAKLRQFLDDPVYIKFIHEIVGPFTSERLALDYEMEPGKNIKYS
jgi:hypothetical protein